MDIVLSLFDYQYLNVYATSDVDIFYPERGQIFLTTYYLVHVVFDRSQSSLYYAYLRHATKTAEQSPRKSSPADAKISVIQGWSAKPDEDVDLIEGCNRKIQNNVNNIVK